MLFRLVHFSQFLHDAHTDYFTTYIHINISYKLPHCTVARRTQSEMVRISLGLPRVRPSDAGDSTSSLIIGSKHEALSYGAGAGAVGGAALTGVGAMTRSKSSGVGRRQAVARVAGVWDAEDET